jgi:predicted dienelactone hydrolase
MATAGPLAGRIDTSRIGMAGHSFGAITTLIAAGQRLPAPFDQTLAAPRIRAAMVMSPSSPRAGFATPDCYARMLMPIFHITGTRDDSPVANLKAAERLEPFKAIANVDQYLLVLDGANHMTFTDRPRIFGRDFSYPERDRHQQLVKIAATAYWDSRLNENDAAREWLDEGGFATELGDQGTFEVKAAR